ncbi:MAG: Lrp/AsnC family transcriptional regulator [Methylobacterium sp.]|uniref:Lrp/AsnC family transcriptional regulator n=1 Tax=Methylobacterium sp. TaxID=409 RepID=UPI00258501B4|nr:Lrp/AsnC family transcriptional regulator [Methylobacterium sp.]MBY0294797.1 Lrp/AsnC family transcriptional regulator [Methylobacterium sp.]
MRKSPPRSNSSPQSPPPAAALDRIDRKILDLLQRDSRITNLELAGRVGLSPAPCSRRVKRLHDDGFISREVAIVDPARVGNTLIAFVSVELDRQREDVLATFERKMAAQKVVQQCYFISGESDYLLVVACRDMEHYNAFVREVLANEHNIRRFRTSFNLNRVKYETAIDLEAALD